MNRTSNDTPMSVQSYLFGQGLHLRLLQTDEYVLSLPRLTTPTDNQTVTERKGYGWYNPKVLRCEDRVLDSVIIPLVHRSYSKHSGVVLINHH